MKSKKNYTETDILRNKLIAHLSADFEKYKQSLLELPPEEILEVAHSYHIRESALNAVIYDDFLSKQQMQALLQSKTPLQDIFDVWCNDDPGEAEFMEVIRTCVKYSTEDYLPRRACNIEWDEDDEAILATLPKTVEIPAGVKLADVMDYIEKITGHTVLACSTQVIKEV